MRQFVVGCLALLLGITAGCADNPMAPSMQPALDGAMFTESSSLQGCVITGTCPLPPWIVRGTPQECDPWLDPNWCAGEQCMMGVPVESSDDFVGIASCPIGGEPTMPAPGGPGGGGSSPPPAKPPLELPDTACNTPNDPIVTSSAIQSAFATIWQQSNYGLPHPQRREQGGWITSDGSGGFQFTPFPSSWAREPCRIGFPSQITPPPNIVAWVHTHPYRSGEALTECEQQTLPNGLRFPFTYRGDPSYADDEITRTLRQAGYTHVRGYILDENRITWFTGDDTPTSVGSYSRCGY